MKTSRINKKKNLEEIVFNGKIPPQALEFESAVLGACLIEKDAVHKVLSLLTPESFYSDSHKLIWEAVVELESSYSPIDMLTVSEQLKKTGNLELAGGRFYISQLTASVSSSANMEYHAAIIKQKYVARELIRICSKVAADAFEDTTDPFNLKDRAISDIEFLSGNNISQVRTLGDVAHSVMETMKNNSVMEQNFIGVPSKFRKVNENYLGYIAPGVYVIAAGPGEGKTTLSLNEAFFQAENGYPVLYLCAEQKDYQLVQKLFSDKIKATLNEIKLAKKLTMEQWDAAAEFVKKAKSIPLFIMDVAGKNIDQICSLTKEMHRKYNIKMMYLDYLQLISGSADKKYGTRELEVSDVSRRIKELAMNLVIPIGELCQVSRFEKGVVRLYQLSDLRESGAIEQNADDVTFLFKPSKHEVTELKGESGVTYGPNDVIFDKKKAREGDLGKFVLTNDAKYSSFEDKADINDILNRKVPTEVHNFVDYTQPQKDNDPSEDLPF